jgi:hypothetical protein
VLNSTFVHEVRKLQRNQERSKEPDIYIDYDTWSFRVFSDELQDWVTYKAEPSGRWLHENKENNLVLGIMGAFGSGKTTACNADIILQTSRLPKAPNGVRYARALIVRQTYGQLEKTTYASWMQWFSRLGKLERNKKPHLTVRHYYSDQDGQIELEVIFLALNSLDEAIAKLKSLDITFAYINEASEMYGQLLSYILARTGRYKLQSVPELRDYKKVIFDTNPPNERNWIYNRFEKDKPLRNALYKQPPGLLKDENGNYIPNLEAENVSRLGLNYYMDMVYGETEEYIKVFCLGNYGKVNTGKLIYEQYNDDIHSSNEIKIDPLLPVYIGMDFGLTPCAIFLQISTVGYIHVFHEITTEQLDTREFAVNCLVPYINTQLKDCRVEAIIGDPAGNNRHENSKTSSFDILHEYGVRIVGAPSNLPEKRWDAVKRVLNTLVMGKPRFRLSRSCTVLRDGFLGEYAFKRLHVRGEKVYDTKADKNFFSHIQDALQYVLLHIVENEVQEVAQIKMRKMV